MLAGVAVLSHGPFDGIIPSARYFAHNAGLAPDFRKPALNGDCFGTAGCGVLRTLTNPVAGSHMRRNSRDGTRIPCHVTNMATKAPPWLDSVIGVPTIGIRMVKNWRLAFRYHEIMLPLLDSWDSAGVGFAVKQPPQGGMIIETVDGTTVRLLADAAVVEFKYTFEMDPWKPRERSIPQPYSQLLSKTVEAMSEVADTLAARAPLLVDRVGVVATTQMHPDTAPPGVQKLIHHYEASWSGLMRKVDANVLVVISTGDDATQCHHRLVLDRTAPDVNPNLELTLDWQRLLAGGQKFTAASTRRTIESCAGEALAYFQTVGEGAF